MGYKYYHAYYILTAIVERRYWEILIRNLLLISYNLIGQQEVNK